MGMTEERATDERQLFGAVSNATLVRAPKTSIPAVTKRPSRARTVPANSIGWLARLLREAFESEREHGNAFLFVPIFLAVGILIYFSLPMEPSFLVLVLPLLPLVAVSLLASTRPVLQVVALAATVTCTGMVAAKVETWRAGTQMLGSEISTRLTGRVERIEDRASGRVRLTLDVLSTERPVLRYAPQRIRATARAVPVDLRPGDVVQGVVRLMPPSGPVRPQSYDFAFNNYFEGIGAVGFFLTNPDRMETGEAATLAQTLWASVEDWRAHMARRIADQIGGPEGGIAAALITGIRSGIPEHINEALRIVGLYHVISISGLHMALVGGTVMVSLRTGFALAPSFSARRPVKKYAAATALVATAFYLFISGADIAAQRSFIMLGVMLVAVIFDRAALTMRNLAISAIIILIISPHEVLGPSFQMSFAATAGLVAAYSAWTTWRQGKRRSPPSRGPFAASARATLKYAGGMSMTSIVAGGATALFTAWHFQQVSPMGLFANLAAMPFVSILVMPMAVLASLLMPFGLDGLPLQVMGFGIAAMNVIALWLAERSAFDVTGAIPLSAVVALTAALAILTMSGSALRWAAVPLLAVGMVLLFGREMPDVLISEDGKLVALRLDDGTVAVNRARPRAFTIQNWQRALHAGQLARPVAEDAETASGFVCRDDICAALHAIGLIVHAPNEEAAASACAGAAVVVIDDATAQDPCGGAALVVTTRDLARKGSAQIFLQVRTDGKPSSTVIRFAISEPYRPWHGHRRFSREARGLEPYRREP